MNFLITFAVLLSLFIGAAWYMGNDSQSFSRDSIFSPTGYDKRIESVANYPVKDTVIMNIKNINGTITIKGHKHNNVVIQVTKKGNKKSFESVRSQTEATPEKITIETVYDNSYDHQNVCVNYEITVPHSALFESVRCINGSIFITDVKNSINCSSTNGSLVIEGSHKSVAAQTVNGSVDILVKELPADAVVTAQTNNGKVICSLAQNISGTLKATVSVGQIASEIDLDKQEVLGVTGKKVETQLGNGQGGTISCSSQNGNILIRKK